MKSKKREKRHIPNRLRKYRILKGNSQSEVADQLSLKSIVPIDNWEKGLSLPNLENLLKLSILYEVREEELYNQVAEVLRSEMQKRVAPKKKKQ